MSEEDFCSVEEFLEKFKGKLQIPSYQRGYAWEAKQVEQLVEDVRSAEKGTYFLGTVILHNNEDENVLDIVDGQQRVRTLVALLYEEAKDSEIYKIKVIDPNEKSPKKTIGESGVPVSEKVRECLRACRMAYVTVEDLGEAFQLFDTQNGRGKPLSVANLLKQTRTVWPNPCRFLIWRSRFAKPFRTPSGAGSFILSREIPPCIFKPCKVATRIVRAGFRPLFLHLMLKNFSAPRSAPKPASVMT